MRRREFVRNFRRTTLQAGLSSFGSSLFPVANFSLKFFQMRRARVDLFEQLSRLGLFHKNRQRSDTGFSAGQYFKLLLLAVSFLFCPCTRRIIRDRFNSPNTRCDRVLAHDAEWPDLSSRAHMRAATKLHRITIERF